MEDGLGAAAPLQFMRVTSSLNPCFSGGWSRSVEDKENTVYNLQVLILVLVEDGLGEFIM